MLTHHEVQNLNLILHEKHQRFIMKKSVMDKTMSIFLS